MYHQSPVSFIICSSSVSTVTGICSGTPASEECPKAACVDAKLCGSDFDNW